MNGHRNASLAMSCKPRRNAHLRREKVILNPALVGEIFEDGQINGSCTSGNQDNQI